MNYEYIVKYWETHYLLPHSLTDEQILHFWASGLKPYSIRVETVKYYGQAFILRTLIETGTFHGTMIESTLNNFERFISIELMEAFASVAKQKFAPYPQVKIIHGDSGKELGKVLKSVKEPCLFWLDGHYSFEGTARGNLDTPILQELDHILQHPVKNHVILIDDARCFIGQNNVLRDYPTIQQLHAYVKSKRPELQFWVKDDIIRIHP